MGSVTFEQSLIGRGINPPLAAKLASDLDGQVIADTLVWFDAQRGRVGAGVLVAELRKGGRPATQASLMQREISYGNDIRAWLRRHFPEWNTDSANGSHPAAIAAVIRLHRRHGKGRLSAREHGSEIRAAVGSFEAEYGSPGGKG